jgi:hypothetical protein
MGDSFRIQRPFQPKHPSTLAVYCSDGRFTQAVEELAGEPVDTICLPGGPGLLDSWTSSVLDAQLVFQAADFLMVKHASLKVILVAHEGCGYYREHYPDMDEKARQARQIADLAEAVAKLQKGRAHVKVRAYFAAVEASGIVFHPTR